MTTPPLHLDPLGALAVADDVQAVARTSGEHSREAVQALHQAAHAAAGTSSAAALSAVADLLAARAAHIDDEAVATVSGMRQAIESLVDADHDAAHMMFGPR